MSYGFKLMSLLPLLHFVFYIFGSLSRKHEPFSNFYDDTGQVDRMQELTSLCLEKCNLLGMILENLTLQILRVQGITPILISY